MSAHIQSGEGDDGGLVMVRTDKGAGPNCDDFFDRKAFPPGKNLVWAPHIFALLAALLGDGRQHGGTAGLGDSEEVEQLHNPTSD